MHHKQHPSYILPLDLKINPHYQKWDVARSYMAPTSWQVVKEYVKQLAI